MRWLRGFVFLALLLSHNVWAWNMSGHRIMGRMVYQQLSPHSQKKVDELLAPLGKIYPGYEQLANAAAWPDFIKMHDISAFNRWHYVNFYFDNQGNITKKSNPDNILWAISQAKKTLKSHRTLPIEKAMALCFLVHFIGDLHQPLHVGVKISEGFPNGDKGGNLFRLPGQFKSLHALWDSGSLQYQKKKEKGLALTLQQKYPPPFFIQDLKRQKPDQWAKESLKMAQKNAYLGIEPNQKPTPEYLDKTRKLANIRLTLAAYRSAQWLEALL